MIFQIAGNNGKYINIYYKTKKKSLQKSFWAYCPNYILKIKFLYCKKRFVLQSRWLEGGWFKERLYCDCRFCIAA